MPRAATQDEGEGGDGLAQCGLRGWTRRRWCLVRLGARARRAQSRDGPARASPFGSPAVGSRVERCGRGQIALSRRRTTRSARDGFAASRSDRIGRPSGVPASTGQATADGRVVPGEAELVGAVVLVRDEVDSSSGSRARKPWATPVGMTTQSSAPSSRVSTTAAAPDPSSSGRTSTSATNARPARHDPVGRAGGDGGGGRAGRRRAEVDRLAWTNGRRRAGKSARRATARGTRRGSSAWRAIAPVADAGQRGRPVAVALGVTPRPARRAGGPARSRPSRRARPQRLAGRQRRRREDAPARRARRALPGRRRDVDDLDRRGRPGRRRSAPSRPGSRTAR